MSKLIHQQNRTLREIGALISPTRGLHGPDFPVPSCMAAILVRPKVKTKILAWPAREIETSAQARPKFQPGPCPELLLFF